MSRPHISSSIEELEKMFSRYMDNMSKLEELAAELQHRGTARAQRLGGRVTTRLAALKGPGAQKDDTGRLRGELAKSLQEIDRLRSENRALAAALSAAKAREAGPSPAQEGRIPQMLTAIKALKKAVQKSYHPDRCTSMTSSEANTRFVNIMNIFETIEKLRF
ncbi:hypothetical protein GIY56_00065 [Paracoccus sp. YIM 132242]|uniref:J domain-containing protein n=1 Tax=Paracoccus lichenicola TaxID=2665644 RepID=A0A6L6HKB5_9RHOB|nr:hypothetical protein [Paracoccus lichenicola]MTD98680.1 hypothetical protein [Paracoccus lichenicola]